MKYEQPSNFLKNGLMTALAFTILAAPFSLANNSITKEKADIKAINDMNKKADQSIICNSTSKISENKIDFKLHTNSNYDNDDENQIQENDSKKV